MFLKFKFSFEYSVGNKNIVSQELENEHYSLSSKYEDGILGISVIPKTSLEMKRCRIIYDYDYPTNSRVFANGYQSWSTSREYRKSDVQKGLMGLGQYSPVKKFTSIFGDYDFVKYSKKTGVFHSHTYGYIREEDDVFFVGSLSERQGYTILWYDLNNNKFSIEKDLEGVSIEKEYQLYFLYTTEGSYNEVFDRYFRAMNIPKPRMDFLCGYTSWYNYFGKITQKILERDLQGLADKLGNSADIFQIDDGYQTAIGDWLIVDEKKFPNGMKYLADKIHSNGYKAGIWLAPFSAQRSSKVAKQHPDWLIKDAKGKPILGSIAWGGAYTIDFYNEEAASYIKNCFNTVLNDWGYDLVKLDFLYSICMQPRNNKSRGQIMCEAMDFLRECVGKEKYILGCGVPLGPAFGKVDCCRISCDVDLVFSDRCYIKHTNQEIVNTKNAMNNTIFRRHLDGRVFANDPDVFILRDNDLYKHDDLSLRKGKLKYTFDQKKLLAKINNMFGSVLFVSDNVGGYNDEQLKLIKQAFLPSKTLILDAEYVTKDEIAIKYVEGKKTFQLKYNVNSGVSSTTKLK